MHVAIASNRKSPVTNVPISTASSAANLAVGHRYFNEHNASKCRVRLEHFLGILSLHLEDPLTDGEAETVAGEGG